MSTQHQFDHIAIGALNLDEGVAHIKSVLGVDVPAGGKHPLMGTHNCLMSLGNDTYLEVIAVDPGVPAPARSRWFGLDSSVQQQTLSNGPKPIAWIIRTEDIKSTLKKAQAAGIDLGKPIEMTRGTLSWIISVRDDGSLPENGTLPLVIQWPDGPHPASTMQDFSFRLHQIRIQHPHPQELMEKLESINAAHLATVDSSPGHDPSIRCDVIHPNGKILHL